MGIFEVESFFSSSLEQLLGSFSDIGAHQDFQMSEFFIPKLSIKELYGLNRYQACKFEDIKWYFKHLLESHRSGYCRIPWIRNWSKSGSASMILWFT